MNIVFGLFHGGNLRPHQTAESVVSAGYFGYYDFQIELFVS